MVTENRSSWRGCRCSAATRGLGPQGKIEGEEVAVGACGRLGPGDPLAVNWVLDALADFGHRLSLVGSEGGVCKLGASRAGEEVTRGLKKKT